MDQTKKRRAQSRWKRWRNWIWALVTLALAVLTTYILTKEANHFSFRELVGQLLSGNLFYLGGAVFCTVWYIYAEGEALFRMLRFLGQPVRRRKAFVYASADVYFSAITPSASGGQPAVMVFMGKDGIPAWMSGVCLLINLLMYTFATVVIGVVCLLFGHNIYRNYPVSARLLIIVGFLLLGGLMILFLLLLRRGDWIHRVGGRLIRLLARHRIVRHPEKARTKLAHAVGRYKECSEILLGNKKVMAAILILNLLQRALQIAVPSFVHLCLGGEIRDFGKVWLIQAFSVIGSNCIPVPGAMGVIDYLMTEGFSQLLSADGAIRLDLASRGLSFYGCIAVSICAILISWLVSRIGRRREKTAS